MFSSVRSRRPSPGLPRNVPIERNSPRTWRSVTSLTIRDGAGCPFRSKNCVHGATFSSRPPPPPPVSVIPSNVIRSSRGGVSDRSFRVSSVARPERVQWRTVTLRTSVASLPHVIRPLPSPYSQSSTVMFSTGGLGPSWSANGPLLPLSAIVSSCVAMAQRRMVTFSQLPPSIPSVLGPRSPFTALGSAIRRPSMSASRL